MYLCVTVNVPWNYCNVFLRSFPVSFLIYLPKNRTILNKNINTTCQLLVSCFISWNKRSQKCSMCTKSLFFSNCVHKFVYIPVSEHFSFAKIIHPPDRYGQAKMCTFVTQHNGTDVLRGSAIGAVLQSCYQII